MHTALVVAAILFTVMIGCAIVWTGYMYWVSLRYDRFNRRMDESARRH